MNTKNRQDAIVDSSLTLQQALRQNPSSPCPPEVIAELELFNVHYYSFDGQIHIGQIVAHKDLVEDIQGAFRILLAERFPIQSVIPIADERFGWDDTVSTSVNNTSAFNYRNVRNTDEISNHAAGRAIDINPLLNPYFPGEKVFPAHASYDQSVPGTIVAGSSLVEHFTNLGWFWGASWADDPDYQHFEKLT
ncbi:M15 family metallopeptidase [Candidatus Saccharibacteria bacterium]|nr:M15 family metallopeptidase [Candidatus Saccharibacteria bacterium]